MNYMTILTPKSLLNLIDTPEPHPGCKDMRGTDERDRMIEAVRRPKRLAEKSGIGF